MTPVRCIVQVVHIVWCLAADATSTMNINVNFVKGMQARATQQQRPYMMQAIHDATEGIHKMSSTVLAIVQPVAVCRSRGSNNNDFI